MTRTMTYREERAEMLSELLETRLHCAHYLKALERTRLLAGTSEEIHLLRNLEAFVEDQLDELRLLAESVRGELT
jgi:hypothetical protein